ncbi:MAG: DNA-binding transcriptional LysR family regulator [Gammaproteobacteria bacterium]|jgi:DNA-binding transcriptional LysR family regulator
MKQNIDILALRSFILAEKLGSFAKAAGNLNCSPAALSFRIKKLEETLGTRLFHRNYHNLQLTASGRNLLGEANNLIKTHDRIVNTARQIEAQEIVKVGVPEDLTHNFFKDVMSHHAMADRGINIELTMRLSRDLIELANEEKLHMAIATVPPEFLGGEHLGSRRLLWVSAHDYEWKPGGPIPLALHPSRCVYRDLILSVLEASGIDFRITFSAQGSMSVQAAVAAGLGLTVIAEGMLPSELVQVPDDWKLPDLGTIDIRLFKNKNLSPLQLELASTLTSAFCVSIR